MTPPSLEAIDLTKRFNHFVALDSLNLRVSGSKCVGFLGPNGAGKTTTLKLFSDMIYPTRGTALINEVDVHAHKRRALDAAGILVETPEIYPAMTPRDALSLIAEIRGIPAAERRSRIETVLAEVAMTEWIDKRVGEFSKGMKQRINIAAVLLPDPEIVILDEPTTGLDPRGMAEVRDVIRTLKRRQKLVFMSSHLLGEVADVCDEVAMINHGKLLIYDTLERVMTRTNTAGTVVEVGFSHPIDAPLTHEVSGIPGVQSVDRLDTLTLQLSIAPGLNVQEQVLKELVSRATGVVRYQPSSSALEASYLDLIKDSR